MKLNVCGAADVDYLEFAVLAPKLGVTAAHGDVIPIGCSAGALLGPVADAARRTGHAPGPPRNSFAGRLPSPGVDASDPAAVIVV